MTSVLLADDHQLLRQALRRALEDAGYTVVAEAGDGEEALRLADDVCPDLVVMDVTMPVLDGLSATRRLRAVRPDLPVVMLSMHGEEQVRREAEAAGATRLLSKDCSLQEVVAAVAASTPGATVVPETVLSKRETEVLQQIADGYSTIEVAARLFISAKTVKNHLAAIYEKLDARDRTQAVTTAVRRGIVRIR